ncbi:MAG: hypothetical protein CFE21_21960 [Bacteroidetes bacterium B1(2017)]|nr:MAG: hypothetical protein CFE21_21960 [Bacteroidetes bacterium B1(2017)]
MASVFGNFDYYAFNKIHILLIGENPSIGIIICKGKNKTVVEHVLRSTTSPIGVSNNKLTETPARSICFMMNRIAY